MDGTPTATNMVEYKIITLLHCPNMNVRLAKLFTYIA